MTTHLSFPGKESATADFVQQLRIHGWTWRTGGALLGLSSGILSALIGSLLTALAWFTGPKWQGFSLRHDGTVLLFLTIPLLIFGTHCLDLMDKHDEEQRKSRLGID